MTKNQTMIRDFTEGPVTKLLLRFSAPLFLANLLQIVYNMVDMIVVGNVVGKAGISAVSVGGDVSNLMTFFAMGFSNAGQVIISQYLGAGQKQKVGKFIGTMCTFLGIVALSMTALGLVFREQLLSWMKTPEEAWANALAYSVTCITGLIFIYGYNVVSAVLRGMGDSRHPFLFIALASCTNIVLDLVFVAGLGLEAFGAALATVISQAVSFLCAVGFFVKNRERFGFEMDRTSFRIDRELLGTLVRLGIPMAIKQTSVMISKLFVNAYINSWGVTVSAVAGIGNKLSSISNLLSNSLNTAGSSMVGQNVGAKKYDRVPKIMLTVFLITLSVSVLLAVLIVTVPETVFMLFTDDHSIMDVAMEFVPVAVLIFFGSAARAPMNALVNGSGNYKVNFAVAMLDGIVMRIGCALLLGKVLGLGYLGFWYGDAIAGFTPLWIGLVYYATGSWKSNKYVVKEKE